MRSSEVLSGYLSFGLDASSWQAVTLGRLTCSGHGRWTGLYKFYGRVFFFGGGPLKWYSLSFWCPLSNHKMSNLKEQHLHFAL